MDPHFSLGRDGYSKGRITPTRVAAQVFSATAWYADKCFDVNVFFDKEKVIIYNLSTDVSLRSDYVLKPNLPVNMVLVNKVVNDPSNVSVFDTQNNILLKLNILETNCLK